MRPGTYNLYIPCLSDWSVELKFKDDDGELIDLSAYTFDLDIRRDGTQLVEATCAVSGNTLTVSIARNLLPNTLAGSGVYDLLAKTASKWEPWMMGTVELHAGVSDGS